VKKRSDPTQIVREIYDKLSLDERFYGGSLDAMLATPMLQLDEELLAPKRTLVRRRRTSFSSTRGIIRFFDFCCDSYTRAARA
jgi:hypothetical protein